MLTDSAQFRVKVWNAATSKLRVKISDVSQNSRGGENQIAEQSEKDLTIDIGQWYERISGGVAMATGVWNVLRSAVVRKEDVGEQDMFFRGFFHAQFRIRITFYQLVSRFLIKSPSQAA